MVFEAVGDLHLEMLRKMLRIRLFEEAALELQAQGVLPGAMHTSIGQEAVVVGACLALDDDDYNVGNHRSHGHPIGRGSDLGRLMAELLGRASGVCKGKGGSMHLADFGVGSLGESGVVGAGIPIANGAALSAKLRGTSQVALAFFGDGAANTGPFHESLNLAGIWKLPTIFLCENNGYAVTSSARDMMAAEDVATRAVGYGMPGEVVDGQDVLAVHGAVSRAVDRARAGDGPTLLDVKTYRYRHHSELGGVQRILREYRTDEEVAAWVARDPIALFRQWLTASDESTEEECLALEESVRAEVDRAVEFAIADAVPELASAYDDVYSDAIPLAPGSVLAKAVQS